MLPAVCEVDVAVLGVLSALAALASLCWERDTASFNVGRFELVVESTFTIGFLNDLILITATADQNFSAIAPRISLLFNAIWPFRRLGRLPECPLRSHGLSQRAIRGGLTVHS